MRNVSVTKNIITFVIAHYEESCEWWRYRPIILFWVRLIIYFMKLYLKN